MNEIAAAVRVMKETERLESWQVFLLILDTENLHDFIFNSTFQPIAGFHERAVDLLQMLER